MEHALHKKEMVVSKIWSVTLPCLMFKMKTAAHYELSQVEEILLTWVWHFHFWLDPINYAHFGLTLYLVGVTVTLHCSLTHLSWDLLWMVSFLFLKAILCSVSMKKVVTFISFTDVSCAVSGSLLTHLMNHHLSFKSYSKEWKVMMLMRVIILCCGWVLKEVCTSFRRRKKTEAPNYTSNNGLFR